MSSTELSREIASLVSRARGGEAIDPAAAGASLARRYPHLFLSGELMGKAIARAAGMVGVVLTGSEAALAPPAYQASEAALWYAEPRAPVDTGRPSVTVRGWFAPPKSGRATAEPGAMPPAVEGPGIQADWPSASPA